MSDRSLMTSGAIGVSLAAVCCVTPLLAVVLGGFGLVAWLADADYVLIPALIMSIAVLGLGLYRRRAAASCSSSTVKANGSA